MDSAIDLVSTAIDERANGLVLGVSADDLVGARERESDLAGVLDVPVKFKMHEPEVPAHCLSRSHCHGPMKAGIKITDPDLCTMGFHIERNASGDRQLVTAGHCGYGSTNAYYHDTIYVGAEVQTLYVDEGQDIMRVELWANQESDDVFAASSDITFYEGTPSQGETLCASLGNSNELKCGTVESTWVAYNFGASWGNYDIWGGDMSFTIIGGDSGSPLYRKLANGIVRAIGVMSSIAGKFARLDRSLDDFNSFVYY